MEVANCPEIDVLIFPRFWMMHLIQREQGDADRAGSTLGISLLPMPQERATKRSRVQERLRVIEAQSDHGFDQEGWSGSQGTLTQTDNDREIEHFLPQHDVTQEASELSHNMLRKKKRETLNSPRFTFLCLVEMRLKTKIKMFDKKESFLSCHCPLSATHIPSKAQVQVPEPLGMRF